MISVRKSIKWNLIASVYDAIVGILIFFLLSRVFEPARYALIGFMFSITSFIGIFSNFGIPIVVGKFIPEFLASGNQERLKSTILFGALSTTILGTVASFILFFSANWLGKLYGNVPNVAEAARIFSFFILFQTMINYVRGVITGHGSFKRYAILLIVFRTLSIVAVVVAYKTNNILNYFLITMLIFLIFASVGFYISFSLYFAKLKNVKADRHFLGKFLLYALPVSITSAAVYLYSGADMIIVGLFCSANDIGLLAFAGRIVALTWPLNQSISSVVSVKVASLMGRNEIKQIQKEYKKFTNLALIFGAFIGVFLFTLSYPILKYVFPKYLGALSLLRLYSFLILIQCFADIINQGFLVSTGNAKIQTQVQIVGAFLTVLLDLLFIPQYGIIGCVWANIISRIIFVVLLVYSLKKHVGLSLNFNFSISSLKGA